MFEKLLKNMIEEESDEDVMNELKTILIYLPIILTNGSLHQQIFDLMPYFLNCLSKENS